MTDATAPSSDTSMMNAVRAAARHVPESGIVRVLNHALARRKPFIPLLAGEGHVPTPDFIMDAAHASLTNGETFYTHQKGIPPLRKALASYHERHFQRPFDAQRFIVTGSGMQAIQLTIQAIAGAGDEIILPLPAWPNFAGALSVMGAVPIGVPMTFDGREWSLDLDALAATITPRTKALFINSPCNPNGWVADDHMLIDILTLARRHDLWIIADEVYNRIVYNGNRAPSFYDHMEQDDRIIFVNTFSKNWAMTGWRIGWVSAPPILEQIFENLVQYSTSGVATFMQRAAVAALDDGDSFVDQQVAYYGRGRDILCDALAPLDQVQFQRPDGAFYLFLRLPNRPNTIDTGLELVDAIDVAMSPGEAFGPDFGGYLRLCFARSHDELQLSADRLTNWLRQQA